MIGVGQTHHRAKREDVSIAGLCREAIDRALADANLGFDDIDAIVVGKAPDLFEGVMMPELFLAEALGAAGKPLLRVHTAGSVGGSTAIVAASLVQAGVHKRVLTMAFEKQSESNAMWALSVPVPFNMPVHAGAGGYFAPHVRSYIRRSEAPTHIGAIVAAKDRQNALKNPYAHLRNEDTTVESVLASQMLWDPIRYDETCPSSDGACALVIVDEDTAKSSPNPAWIHGTVMRSEATTAAERDQVNPQASRDAAAAIWKQAGITNPVEEIDCAEIYVPFSWFEPMWLESLGFAEQGDGWKLTESGETALDGKLPVNMSGGVLSSNPIGASGMLRFAEAALQVRGDAGEHQVEGARRALGHAYGGGSQFFAMWVVGQRAADELRPGWRLRLPLGALAAADRSLDGLVDGLDHAQPRVPLGVALDEVPRRLGGARLREHVLHGLGVLIALLPVAPILVGQLPRLERIFLASLEAPQLLLVGDVHPELDEDGALHDQHRLELADLGVGPLPRVVVGVPLDAFDQHPAVPGAVEDGHATPAGQLRPEPPQPVVPQLVLRGRRERAHADVARIELPDEPLDRSALAGSVPALEDDAHRRAELAVPDETAEPQPQGQQPALLLLEPLLRLLLRQRQRHVELIESSHPGSPPASARVRGV